MRLCLLIGILFTVCVMHAQDAVELTWPDLLANIEFDDPFEELTRKQLFDLSEVARTREREASSDYDVSAEQIARKDSLEQVLFAEGVDVDSLLSIRYEIKALREKRAESVNEALDGSVIRIAGYLLPLNYDAGKVTEFLLVPWVGACIHTPPPPKNQLIYIQTIEGFEFASQFQAVSVEGMIHTGEKTSTLFLVDGTSDIPSGYSMRDARISLYNN